MRALYRAIFAINAASHCWPCSQLSRPDSPLICPLAPIRCKSAPHAVAHSCAKDSSHQGSFSEATTQTGNGKAINGMGAKLLAGKSARPTSGGATSMAALTLVLSLTPGMPDATHQAVVAQPRLWATSTTSSVAALMAVDKVATHSAFCGVSQFCC